MGWFEDYQRSKRLEIEQINDCVRFAKNCGLTFEQRAPDSISWTIHENGEQRFNGMLIHCLCYLKGYQQARHTR